MSHLIAVRDLSINSTRRNDSMKNLTFNSTSKWQHFYNAIQPLQFSHIFPIDFYMNLQDWFIIHLISLFYRSSAA